MIMPRSHLIEKLSFEVMIKMDKETLQAFVYQSLLNEYEEIATRFLLNEAIRLKLIPENENVTVLEND